MPLHGGGSGVLKVVYREYSTVGRREHMRAQPAVVPPRCELRAVDAANARNGHRTAQQRD